MAYQTGPSSNPNDLLVSLRVFAVAQGWTVNRFVAAGNGFELCISKGSAYFNFRSAINEAVRFNDRSTPVAGKYGIFFNGSDAYSASQAWDVQPGFPFDDLYAAGVNQVTAGMEGIPGPYRGYHLFAPDDKCIYLEVEVSLGVFQRLGFGSLDLFSASAPGGGRFFYGSLSAKVSDVGSSSDTFKNGLYNSDYSPELVPFRSAFYSRQKRLCASFLRASFGSFDGWCGSARLASASLTPECCQGGDVHDHYLRTYSPNPMNGIGVLLPNVVSVNRGSDLLSPVGTVPGMRYMNMLNYQPTEEFPLGPDTWKVFPWYQRDGMSGLEALAYLKTA